MATVVNNPAPSGTMSDRTYIERSDMSDSAGWAIAIIVLLAIVALGLFFWVRANNAAAPALPSTINVTTPGSGAGSGGTSNTSPSTPNTGSGSSNTGGTGSGSTGSGSTGSGSTGASGSGSAAGSVSY